MRSFSVLWLGCGQLLRHVFKKQIQEHRRATKLEDARLQFLGENDMSSCVGQENVMDYLPVKFRSHFGSSCHFCSSPFDSLTCCSLCPHTFSPSHLMSVNPLVLRTQQRTQEWSGSAPHEIGAPITPGWNTGSRQGASSSNLSDDFDVVCRQSGSRCWSWPQCRDNPRHRKKCGSQVPRGGMGH